MLSDLTLLLQFWCHLRCDAKTMTRLKALRAEQRRIEELDRLTEEVRARPHALQQRCGYDILVRWIPAMCGNDTAGEHHAPY